MADEPLVDQIERSLYNFYNILIADGQCVFIHRVPFLSGNFARVSVYFRTFLM